tara:strand:- start:912 stop:1352 length:441 start_codon:yes stop_codon:yes gene_type:complete
LTSCDWFVSKEAKTQELVEKEMLEINWNDVDNYPLFETCDETLTKTGQRECFERELLSHCTKTLQEFVYEFEEGVDRTVQVDFLVDQDGRISVLSIEKDNAITDQMPEFDQIIAQSLINLPTLEPALKRGIPVKAKFRIPIVFDSN